MTLSASAVKRAGRFLFPLFLVVCALAAFWPALHAGFIWDDDNYVTHNLTLQLPDALSKIWFSPTVSPQYYPLVFTSFYIEHRLWGNDPFGYHLVNILVHAGSAILLWLALRKLDVPGAALAAAVFVVHPVTVESVAWVTERKNIFAAFFFLASLLSYLHFALPEAATSASLRRRWWLYGLSLFLFILALFSKTTACALPVVLLLLLWWKQTRITKAHWLLIPYFVVGLVLGLNTAWLEVHHVGASGSEWSLSPVDRVLIAGRAVWFYAAKLVAPFNLCFYYPKWIIDSHAAWQYLFPGGVVVVLLLLMFSRRRLGKGPLVAALAYMALLFPCLGFFDFYPMLFSFVADHFQYLAMLAAIPLLTAALLRLVPRQLRTNPRLASIAAFPLIAAIGTATFLQAANYHDLRTLWSSVIPLNPTWNALSGLSSEDLKDIAAGYAQNLPPEALRAALDNCIRLDSEAVRQRPSFPEGHNNLAIAFMLKGEWPRALAEAQIATKLAPASAMMQTTLGQILYHMGDVRGSERCFTQALTLDQNSPFPRIELGRLLIDTGNSAAATVQLRKAVELDANSATAHRLLAYAYASQDQISDAIAEYSIADRLAPHVTATLDGFARAVALDSDASPEQLAQALAAAKEACQATHNAQPSLLDTLAMVYHRLGQPAQSIALTQQALAIVKSSPDPQEEHLLKTHLAYYLRTLPTSAPATQSAGSTSR